jgi:hypothetical protein
MCVSMYIVYIYYILNQLIRQYDLFSIFFL